MVEIQFYDPEVGAPEISDLSERQAGLAQLLQHAAEETLQAAGSDPSAGLTLVLSNDAHLHVLNRQFLEIDAPTDVLSFPAGDLDPETTTVYLGDVIISTERAHAQAEVGGHPVEDELQLLVVHGVLHLLGHDHADESQKAAMWSLQSQALEALGCSLRP